MCVSQLHQLVFNAVLVVDYHRTLDVLVPFHGIQIATTCGFGEMNCSVSEKHTTILVSRFKDESIQFFGELFVSAKRENSAHVCVTANELITFVKYVLTNGATWTQPLLYLQQ